MDAYVPDKLNMYSIIYILSNVAHLAYLLGGLNNGGKNNTLAVIEPFIYLRKTKHLKKILVVL